jgi:sodium/bile acid cotransporter 7
LSEAFAAGPLDLAVLRSATLSRLRENWFLLALAAAVAAGLFYPEGGRMLRAAPGLLMALTAASLFFSGLSLDLSELRNANDVRAVALALTATYVVAPLAALALGLACGPPGAQTADSDGYRFVESMMILGSQAGTIASAPALTLIAGGNQALALVITVGSNSLTSLLTPLILELSIGAVVAFPGVQMAGRVAGVVLLPVAAAQLVRRAAGPALRSRLRYGVRASQLVILVFVYTGVAAAAGALVGRPSLILRFFVAAACLHVTLILFTDRAARQLGLTRASRAAVVLCGSQKTLPNGMFVWGTFFAANPYGAVALVQYHVLQLVLDTLLVPWLRDEPAPASEAVAAAEELVDGP